MNSEVYEVACTEFEFAFGDSVRLMSMDNELYDDFLTVFQRGVDYGLAHPQATKEDFEVEAATRFYFADGDSSIPLVDSSPRDATARGCSMVFTYAAMWAQEAFRDQA